MAAGPPATSQVGARNAIREELRERLETLRQAPAYLNYERARDWVLDVKAEKSGGETTSASAYWNEELDVLEYMLDASPLVIERLREHTYTVTGLRAYDYRTGKDEAGRRFANKLDVLRRMGGDELLVPEPPILGGFGHEIDGALYNIDTLKYYEVLIGMDRGGILGAFRDADGRKIVLEIGAGWGGFAYAFKTLFPDTTYVIVDLPELFLFSGTFLPTAFPDARLAFYGDEGWDPGAVASADFVFVPNTALSELQLPQLDLAVNMVSFQEMTEAQVDEYVRRAYELESPFLYSLNRDRSLYNVELESVSAIIDRYYWAHEIPILPVNYMKMLREPKKGEGKMKLKATAPPPGNLEYRHIAGNRRVLTGES
jgi:hypothetical protein